MPIAKRRISGSAITIRKCCALGATWLAFAWSRPAFPADALTPGTSAAPPSQISDIASGQSQPEDVMDFLDSGTAVPGTPEPKDQSASSLRLAPIALRWGGSLGYDIEQRSNKGGNAIMRQLLTLNLNGRANSFIWQPWMAQVKGGLGYTATRSNSQGTSAASNSISGDIGLYLVPYSRFPFDATVSRTQNYLGAGIGNPISYTKRLDMNQSYTPLRSRDRYHGNYVRSQSGGATSDTSNQDALSLTMLTARFKSQTIETTLSRERQSLQISGERKRLHSAQVRHRYVPSTELTMDNNFNAKNRLNQVTAESSSSATRDFYSTMFFQPSRQKYSVIAGARASSSNQNTSFTSTRSRSANANLGVSYRPNQYINLSASGNANVSEKDSVWSRSFSTTQNAGLNYPLATLDLGTFHYSSRFTGSLTNVTRYKDANQTSTQTISLSPNHGLNSNMNLNGGKLALSINQSVGVSQSSRSKPAASLGHSAAVVWSRTQDKNNTSIRLGGRDSRSLTRTQDTFQNIFLTGSISEEFNRDSSLGGSMDIQATRQINPSLPNAVSSTNSSASLFYSHQRAFGIPRLIFRSSARTHSRAPLPVMTADPKDQGPITWENSLTYIVGRLTSLFTVNLSKESDGTTQSLIALSLRREF